VDECAVLLQVGLCDDAECRVIKTHVYGLAEKPLQAVGALEDSAGSGNATLRQLGGMHSERCAVMPGEMPFQFDTGSEWIAAS
jgi:hypothetical protein